MFFGAEGESLVVVFEAWVPDPKGGKSLWGAFRGLIVLHRDAAL